MTTPTAPPSSDQTPTAPPPERRAGLDLVNDLVVALASYGGMPTDAAVAFSERFVAGLADVESFSDPAGRVWGQLPMFDPEGTALPFDQRNLAAMETTGATILALSPEAVAVFAGVVYPSHLRAARIARVAWLGRAGEVTEPPDIFNSLDAVAMLHEAMFVRLQQRRQHEQQQVAALLTEQVSLLREQNTSLTAEAEHNEQRLRDAGIEAEPGAAGAGGGP